MDANVKTDPATFEVVKNSLYAAAEEMKVVLAKTSAHFYVVLNVKTLNVVKY